MRKEGERYRAARRGFGPRQRFIIQLPDHLALQVRTLATQGRRPLNTQIEILIERGLRQSLVELA